VDLNRIISGNTYGDLGALKVTTDKFYRITGESTQLEGVKSDVLFPDRYQYIDMGEKDQENPLAWDNITPASYTAWKDKFNYDFVVKQSQYRIQENSFASIIEKQAQWVAEQQKDYDYFLDYDSFYKEQKESLDASKQFDVLKDFDSNLSFKWLPEAGMTTVANDDYIEKRDRWVESLDKDLCVNEAISILNDMSLSLKGNRVSQNKN
jgi:carboxyl-terminal processing protease